MKYCKDCKWCDVRLVWCNSPKRPTVPDMVTGESLASQSNPYDLRAYDIWCGPEAKWFEPKEAK